MVVSGVNIFNMGGGFYFIAVGVGIVFSGIFIALSKLLGAYIYAVTLLMIIIWSFIEEGFNVQELIPRVALPIIFAAYIFSNKIRSRLA